MYGARYDLLRWLAKPGALIPVAALIVIIAVTCLVTGRVSGAVLAVVAVPVAIELTEHVLKPLTGRTKLGFLSYPSGHATATFALAAVLAVLMLNPPGRALTAVLRLIVPAAAVALACVASTAMIGLGFHYFTDTIAGAAVGIGTVTATALVLDLPGPRRWLAAVGGRLRKASRTPQPRGPGQHQAVNLSAPYPPLACTRPPHRTGGRSRGASRSPRSSTTVAARRSTASPQRARASSRAASLACALLMRTAYSQCRLTTVTYTT